MAKGAGKNRRGKAPQLLGTPPPPTGAEVAALQLPRGPPPPTEPEVETTRRLHGGVAPSQATALQLPGAGPQPPQAEVAARPLAIVPAPAHVPPQADAAWFRSLLEVLRLRFPGPVVARIVEALQSAWASVHGWWSGPPPAAPTDDAVLAAVAGPPPAAPTDDAVLAAVAGPESKKKNKNKNKKNKTPVLPEVRRHKAIFYKKDDRKTKKDDRKTKKDPQPSQERVPVIIDGVTVPAATEDRYKRYCRIAGSCSATTTVCHLCIFELELHPNGIVRTSDMITHCNKHESVAVRCGRFGCAAKVPPGLDLRWHTYFCHDLPADWWRRP